MTNAPNPGNEDYQAFQIALQDSLGIVVGDENRGHIEGRLQPIMLRERLSRLSDLAHALREDKPSHIRSEVLDAITTHNAGWFVHQGINRLMGEYILPSLIEKQATECRIWYPACGYGQGAFSLAMVIDGYLKQLGSEMTVEIVATDTSQEAIDYAASCGFIESELQGLPDAVKLKYMNATETGYEVEDSICKMLHFKTCDLVSEAIKQGHFDVIVSPDVLMYFSVGLKRQILEDYASLLDRSGILVLNANEAVLPYCDRFDMIEHEIATFYRQIP